MREVSLYIHLPFCIRKCNYCDFLSGAYPDRDRRNYLAALAAEMKRYGMKMKGYVAGTVFIGGGTPSILETDEIEYLMVELRKNFWIRPEAELTMEANPGTLTMDKLSCYRRLGINRLSIGLQSADNELLRVLGRIHTREEFEVNYQMARECGFDNINIDLMSSLPGQSVPSWEDTLLYTAGLGPEHISAYSLIIEPGTPFYDRYQSGEGLPTEEEDRQMYYSTREILSEFGYHRYEISNYARPGRECVHNLVYWRRGEYLGLGLGAASLMEDRRFTNTDSFNTYVESAGRKDVRTEINHLNRQERMEEFMFLGLRCIEGVSAAEFERQFHSSLDSVYGGVLEALGNDGLVRRTGDRIALTDRGIDVSNVVLAEFLF
ncbi:radical SAM family heme chaperone HemW [Anaerolentibacter hominis]|uniref:radical SAM family heme chaperone HemW n=1 Tax=Anaerolentibacter hominis TaxID=3079009 RepID=UPI0031B82B5B